MLARGGWRGMQRDGLEAGGTGTMLLDSKILARLAGADERLFHRTLSLRRRPATTRTSTTTTIAVPIWVRSLHSTLSRSPFSLVLVISPLHPVEFFSPRPSRSRPTLLLPLHPRGPLATVRASETFGFSSLLKASYHIATLPVYFFHRFAKQRRGNRFRFNIPLGAASFATSDVENLARGSARARASEDDYNSARLLPLSLPDSRER